MVEGVDKGEGYGGDVWKSVDSGAIWVVEGEFEIG